MVHFLFFSQFHFLLMPDFKQITFNSRCSVIHWSRVLFKISIHFQQSACDGVEFKEKLQARPWDQDNQYVYLLRRSLSKISLSESYINLCENGWVEFIFITHFTPVLPSAVFELVSCSNCFQIMERVWINENSVNGVFRTQSNIYDGAFFRKQWTVKRR